MDHIFRRELPRLARLARFREGDETSSLFQRGKSNSTFSHVGLCM